MVRRMLRLRSLVLAGVIAATLTTPLAGCGRKPPEAQAAASAQKLMAAVWAGDPKGFEEALDRPAVRADLRRQLAEVAKARALSVEGGASDAALDRMITPQAFQLTDPAGRPLAAAPSEAQLKPLIAPVTKDRVCLRGAGQGDACPLTFARAEHGWKLVGMAPAGFTLAVPPEPAKDGK
jgi:hypothetical protein